MKNTWDKIVMSEDKKEEIRRSLLQKKLVRHTWIKVVASVAAVICAVMIIPFTRNKVIKAAELLFNSVRSKNGLELDVVYDENKNIISATIIGEATDYVKVVNGRMYFEFNGDSIDITDQCSDTQFYRYIVDNGDNTCNVIYVGGTVDNYGYVEASICPDFMKEADGSVAVWFAGGSASEYADGLNTSGMPVWQSRAYEDGELYIQQYFASHS